MLSVQCFVWREATRSIQLYWRMDQRQRMVIGLPMSSFLWRTAPYQPYRAVLAITGKRWVSLRSLVSHRSCPSSAGTPWELFQIHLKSSSFRMSQNFAHIADTPPKPIRTAQDFTFSIVTILFATVERHERFWCHQRAGVPSSKCLLYGKDTPGVLRLIKGWTEGRNPSPQVTYWGIWRRSYKADFKLWSLTAVNGRKVEFFFGGVVSVQMCVLSVVPPYLKNRIDYGRPWQLFLDKTSLEGACSLSNMKQVGDKFWRHI